MALPVAHAAVAWGMTRKRTVLQMLFATVLAVSPDFDFALVWGLNLSAHVYHRSFSHSLVSAALLTTTYWLLWPGRWKPLPSPLFFAILSSHAVVDLLCTANAADHGVMVFWPLSTERFGWPVLVPLYRLFARTPFSTSGAFRFTILEIALAVPLWATTRVITRLVQGISSRFITPSRETEGFQPE